MNISLTEMEFLKPDVIIDSANFHNQIQGEFEFQISGEKL